MDQTTPKIIHVTSSKLLGACVAMARYQQEFCRKINLLLADRCTIYSLVYNRTWYQKKLLKRLLWASAGMFISTRRGVVLFRNLEFIKASVGRIANCACACLSVRFGPRLVLCWLFEFFPYFDHDHGKGTTNYWPHIFIFSCSEYL